MKQLENNKTQKLTRKTQKK